jgi:hypothetical protein
MIETKKSLFLISMPFIVPPTATEYSIPKFPTGVTIASVPVCSA